MSARWPWFSRRARREALACRDAVALLTAYLDEVVEPADRARLEAHLAQCGTCAEYLAQLRATLRLAAALDPDELSPPTRDALADLYRRAREQR